MNLSLIVAIDLKKGIGKNNDLMWHLPEDLLFFKEKTIGQIVIMGRKNYDSIPHKYRPLKNRENVILTKNKNFRAKECKVFHSFEEYISFYKNEKKRKIFIIGGGEIYNIALKKNYVDTMYITHVNKEYNADTFFPSFDIKKWEVETIKKHEKDKRHEASFTVVKYTRKLR